MRNGYNKLVAGGLALAASGASMLATVPDATDIIETASTTFDTVGALIVVIAGFFIVLKIVKWVRK